MDIIDVILGAKLGSSGSGGSSTFIPSFGTVASVSLGTTWSGNGPYTSTVTVTGYTVTDKTMVSVLPSTAALTQMLTDGTSNIYITNNNGTLTATALGAAPTQAMTLTVLCSESDQAAVIGNLAGIVGDGVLEVLGATDLTDAINILNEKIENLEPGGGAVSDVQINGTSIVSNGVANVPNGSNSAIGLLKTPTAGGLFSEDGGIYVNKATSAMAKSGTQMFYPLTPYHQHEAAFYGLAKAAGHDEKDSVLAFGTYTNEAKTAIRNMLGAGTGDVDDVQINGTSIVDENGVANIPLATELSPGTLRVYPDGGTYTDNIGRLCVNSATEVQIKAGASFKPIAVARQHYAAFYGLAKAAGHDEKNSTLALGTYTEEAKTAIRAMLGVTDSAGGMNVITLTGTNVTQTAAENTMYKCGELAELTFTAPASGITAVRFSSGSTPTVASFPGVTWLGDFDPDNLLSNVTYEINIFDGVGVAGWA